MLLNDPTFVEAARAFAARIIKEGGADDGARIAWAWRQATAREPARGNAGVARAPRESIAPLSPRTQRRPTRSATSATGRRQKASPERSWPHGPPSPAPSSICTKRSRGSRADESRPLVRSAVFRRWGAERQWLCRGCTGESPAEAGSPNRTPNILHPCRRGAALCTYLTRQTPEPREIRNRVHIASIGGFLSADLRKCGR